MEDSNNVDQQGVIKFTVDYRCNKPKSVNESGTIFTAYSPKNQGNIFWLAQN